MWLSLSTRLGCRLSPQGKAGAALGVEMFRVLLTLLGITLRLPQEGGSGEGALQW